MKYKKEDQEVYNVLQMTSLNENNYSPSSSSSSSSTISPRRIKNRNINRDIEKEEIKEDHIYLNQNIKIKLFNPLHKSIKINQNLEENDDKNKDIASPNNIINDILEVKNSNLSTIFLLLNTMIGSGILVQPYVFKMTGIIFVIIEYLLISWMIYEGIKLMMISGYQHNIFDYSKLTRHVLGPAWGLVGDISFVINGCGALLSYIMIMGALCHESLLALTSSTCTSFFCSRIFLTILPIVFFSLPLCLYRKFGHLSMISYLSIAVVLASMSLVIIGGSLVEDDHSSSQGPTSSSNSNSIQLFNFNGSLKTIGNIVFSFGFITGSFHSYSAMKKEERNINNFLYLSRLTLLLGVTMCFLTGIFGYLYFKEDVEVNILQNYGGKVGAFFKLLLVLHLILYIPGDYIIMRSSFWKIFHRDIENENAIFFYTTTILSVFFLTFIAIILVEFGEETILSEVIDVTGGLAGSIMYFIIPSLVGMRERENKKNVGDKEERRIEKESEPEIRDGEGELSEEEREERIEHEVEGDDTGNKPKLNIGFYKCSLLLLLGGYIMITVVVHL